MTPKQEEAWAICDAIDKIVDRGLLATHWSSMSKSSLSYRLAKVIDNPHRTTLRELVYSLDIFRPEGREFVATTEDIQIALDLIYEQYREARGPAYQTH